MNTNKYTIAVIGCGRISNNAHFPALSGMDNVRIKYACDLIPEKAEDKVARFGAEQAITDYKTALDDPEVEAVWVLTPNYAHYTVTMDALKAGKHVFCEKPLADTVEKCKEAEAIIAAHPELTFMLGFMRRYDPGYNQLKKAIDSGKYGLPLMLHCVHRNYDAPGFTTTMPVENSMIHEIDVLRWLLGENYKTKSEAKRS